MKLYRGGGDQGVSQARETRDWMKEVVGKEEVR